jgi:hypothetical protein
MDLEKMIVSANQPYFAPFPGFFYKALLSDILVLLDQVQFPRGTTWMSRNRLKNDKGTLWITIPVWKKGLGFQGIDEVRICREGRWHTKHLESLKTAYSHAPYLDDHMGVLEGFLSSSEDRLVDVNVGIISYLMEYLCIETKVVLQSQLGVRAKGNQLLLAICKQTGCSTFLAQSAAEKHLGSKRFQAEGIELKTFRYPEVIYPQLWGDFIPNLSTVDLVLNCGPRARDILEGLTRH